MPPPQQRGRFSAADLDPEPLPAAQEPIQGQAAPPATAAPAGRFSPADLDAEPAAAPDNDWGGAMMRAVPGVLADVAVGFPKRLLDQGINGGALARKIPGVNWLSDDVLPNLNGIVPESWRTPEGGAQKLGAVGLDVLETVAPAGALSRAGVRAGEAAASVVGGGPVRQAVARMVPRMAVEGTAGAGTSVVQGGNPAVGGAVGAAVPLVGAVAGAAARAAAPRLKASAEKGVMEALKPTKEKMKAYADKITPEILKRGIRGSREGIEAKAAEMRATIGPKVDEALQAYGARTADATPILDALEASKDEYRVVREMTKADLARQPELRQKITGMVRDGVYAVEIATDARPIENLTKLQGIIQELGPEPTVKQLVAVRRAWDTVVSNAGGYAQRAAGGIGQPLADASEAWAKREGTAAIRDILDDAAPELSTINKEYSFWAKLDDVVHATNQRVKPHGPGLGRQVVEAGATAAGAVIGGSAGGPIGAAGTAVLAGKLAGGIKTVMQSPRWQMASAQTKDALAEAIMSGSKSRIAEVIARIAGGPVNAEVSRVPREGSATIYSNRPQANP